MSKKLIIVPFDFSSHAKAALAYARQNFPDRQIKIVCVLEQGNPYELGISLGPDYEADSIAKCRDTFYQQTNEDSSKLDFHVRFGEPSDQIVQFGKECNATHIVMSTHGRTGIKRLFLGSVAQKVISAASCPVILLPNQWFEELTNKDSSYKEMLIDSIYKSASPVEETNDVQP